MNTKLQETKNETFSYYCNKLESIDFNRLKSLNRNLLGLKDLKRSKRFTHYDCLGVASDNRLVLIEIKSRNFRLSNLNDTWLCLKQKPNQENCYTYFDSLIIDINKYNRLIEELETNKEVLYVNFTLDNYVIIYNLRNIDTLKVERVNYYDISQKKIIHKYKFLLPLSEAFIYKKTENNTYNLTQKPKI